MQVALSAIVRCTHQLASSLLDSFGASEKEAVALSHLCTQTVLALLVYPLPIKSMCCAAAVSEPDHDDTADDMAAADDELASDAALVNPEAEPAPQALADAEADAAVEADGQEAAEEAAPAIPAEIPDKIWLQRLADRSAVNAPSDAIGTPFHSHSRCNSSCWFLDLFTVHVTSHRPTQSL